MRETSRGKDKKPYVNNDPKDWQEWQHPIRDFLVPTIQNTLSKGFVPSVLIGGLIGSMFGKTKYGKLIGATIGAGSMLVLSTAKSLDEIATGKPYIPKRRLKEREINEYTDMLKYVKNMKLYENYREQAIKKEHVDPAKIIKDSKEQGEKRQRKIKFYQSIMGKIRKHKLNFRDALKLVKPDEEVKDIKDLEHAINKKIYQLKNEKDVKPISPLAAKAIVYYNKSRQTAYAYEAGDPVQNILAALNRKEREYFQPFLEAPESERKQILKLVPNYMKRALQIGYGMKPDKKPTLEQYFSTHALPDKNWAGWNEDVNLDDIKVKIVKHEGMDMSEFDFWPEDEERASYLDIPVPRINHTRRRSAIRNQLYQVLKGSGLENVNVNVTHNSGNDINVNVNIDNDRREEIKDYINNHGIPM